MKVLGNRILIEQKMTSKKSQLLLPDTVADKEKFDFAFKVLQVGPQCPTNEADRIVVGDTPVFSQYVNFQGTKLIHKDDAGMIVHVIVVYDDIIAIDNDQDSDEKTVISE
tara:strand:+ start:7246 stop:7575 length:330 start_codon:yes stop_codon:yes gene_type:complete